MDTRREPKGENFVISHASFSHVFPVTLFVAWVVAAFRKRDFQKLQRKQGTSVRREAFGEAVHGKGHYQPCNAGHTLRQGWAWGLYPRDGMEGGTVSPGA